ncbi:HAD family phosphatase [Phenylobacterium sp.]|jgi:2-haloacid dehalogenase/putative hydrolase of the HAD superfamily|uniref:HAD family hydrolase n=1 Tax=Phenylobacterium sp. TaxID=1871053 RepID=UPI002E306390|nr:HAD family phosphatase [Phenylobacterium sp.]HEX3364014.1 HAD family phosphatase [Phenylobacterium sp.]
MQTPSTVVWPELVVWDVGNVIVRWDPRTLYSRIFPDPVERDRFLRDVCTMAWHGPTDCGVTFDDNCAALSARHPEHEAAIWAWKHRWSEMFSGPIPETEAAIAALKARGVRQYALTNMSHETEDATFAMSPSFARLDGRIVSGREGMMKPDAAIFRLTCARFGFSPEEALFVDDSATNIAAARALGFQTHHFTDPAALRPALEGFGLL